jgi:hypothetical protein
MIGIFFAGVSIGSLFSRLWVALESGFPEVLLASVSFNVVSVVGTELGVPEIVALSLFLWRSDDTAELGRSVRITLDGFSVTAVLLFLFVLQLIAINASVASSKVPMIKVYKK